MIETKSQKIVKGRTLLDIYETMLFWTWITAIVAATVIGVIWLATKAF